MQFKRQGRDTEGVNLTPLIDVVFLLLIFFMVSTTFTKETHLKVDLPEASGEKAVDKKQQIDILISKDGSYAINGRALVNQQRETVIAALEKAMAGNKDIPLMITADANTTHQAVVKAMDAAGQLGLSQLSITTKQPAKE